MNAPRMSLFPLLLPLALLGGCNSMPERDPAFAASLPAIPRDRDSQPATGGIYRPGQEILLFEDQRARRIGDILTIRLVENNDASKKTKTTTDRSTTTSVTNPTILGTTPQFGLPSALPLVSTSALNLQTSLSSNTAFEGSGDSSQSNSIKGNISVTVADVLPNGNLIVRGEKRFNLNTGNEYIKISGIVRPEDIDSDNTVESTKVADATIIYSGDGQIADANKLGWLARFFISALFPF